MNRWCSRTLIQWPARPSSPDVPAMSRPVCGYLTGSGTTGNIVIAAAEPLRKPVPAEATHAAPMVAIEARWAAAAGFLMRSRMVSATVLAMMPDGIPVRGGLGALTVPLGLLRGREIGCGGANAIPGAKMLGYAGDS